MQSKKYVQNPELPVFNIRKVQKKSIGIGKNLGEGYYYTPEADHQKITDFQNFSNIFQHHPDTHDTRKQKQKILDQTVNEAIVNSKVYRDLKKIHLENKKKNYEEKQKLQKSIQEQKKEKKELLAEREKLEGEKKKYLDAINAMKEKLGAIRETNERYREALNNSGFRIGGNGEEAQYISNLIMSMRFHAEYEHDIDPDQMTYQQLLELEEKIGNVSRGLPAEVIAAILPKIQLTEQLHKQTQQQRCTVCMQNFQIGQIKTIITSCKHEFHYECMQVWLGKQKICPLCKKQVLFGLQEHKKPVLGKEQEINVE